MKITRMWDTISISSNINFELLKKFNSSEAFKVLDAEGKPILYVKATDTAILNSNSAFFTYSNAEGNATMNLSISGDTKTEDFICQHAEIIDKVKAYEADINAKLNNTAASIAATVAEVTEV